ncbi:hypothetical protein AQUCO_01600046v1 [Aquilegia coerulea]|uniref:CBS domain-containing protein n=1 Tax=Aquilegia coerulea TaxID=218851 RepID=A0A2G5DPY0_AQUCA|nr:hypothetical protein AQUCO_01600046v1 [Aquilegia coerulea]
MAINLLSYEVSDLCLGKPPLKSLSITSTVSDALLALRRSEENYLSVWSCNHSSSKKESIECECIGKICIVDVVCYLCNEDNISSPSSALNSPISVLLPKVNGLVQHVDSHLSLLDALDLILEGAQNLVVPIQRNITRNSRKKLHQKSSTSPNLHNGYEFCWITQEDVVRFFLNSIGLFSPMPGYSIESLGIMSMNVLAIGYDDPVFSALDTISSALLEQTSIAVIDDEGKLVGEISPSTLASCDETIVAAIATLSAGGLMAYIDYGCPPEVVKARLKENLKGMWKLLDECCNNSTLSSSSSDEESSSSSSSSSSTSNRLGWISRSGSYSTRMIRSAEAIVCHPGSSLVAVMMQAIVHRVNYVWVIEDDYSFVGIVTFFDILKVFREHLQSIA